MQIIIVCECDSKSKSDYLYIKATIDKNFDLRAKNIKLSSIYLGGKGKWSKKGKKINSLISQYGKNGESKVVFCLDYDNPIKTNNNEEINEKIDEYCKQEKYDLVWFNGNIEQVFLGRDVPRSKKTEEAERYSKNRKINDFDMNKISFEKILLGIKGSNLLVVLNKLINKSKKEN